MDKFYDARVLAEHADAVGRCFDLQFKLQVDSATTTQTARPRASTAT